MKLIIFFVFAFVVSAAWSADDDDKPYWVPTNQWIKISDKAGVVIEKLAAVGLVTRDG